MGVQRAELHQASGHFTRSPYLAIYCKPTWQMCCLDGTVRHVTNVVEAYLSYCSLSCSQCVSSPACS